MDKKQQQLRLRDRILKHGHQRKFMYRLLKQAPEKQRELLTGIVTLLDETITALETQRIKLIDED